MLPLVSVQVITYNHERFVAQCLEGILMQRTNFPFEVIVGEDCSTDRTREIVFDYGRRFPDLIRVITSESNVGGLQNILRVQQACFVTIILPSLIIIVPRNFQAASPLKT
jgi:glycosyltransferase involved in cell wall biosynthesis